MKLNKMYFYRLLLNAGLFLLPLGLWYLCKGVKYGGLLMLLPEYLRITARAVFPLAMQLMGLGISLIDDRFRPFVYGSVLPMVYMGGLILYRLPHEIYRRMVRFIPYANDHFDTKWAKLKKMSEIFMKFDFLSFGAACVCLVLCRLIVVYMWKKLGKKPLLPKGDWKKTKTPQTTSTVHGSARFSSRKQIQAWHQEDKESLPIGQIIDIEIADYDTPGHFVEEIEKKKPSSIFRSTFNHGMVVARTGGGKGVGIIVPTLLDYQGSFVVTDIKGENYAVTAEHRRNQGRIVYLLDAFDLTGEKQTHGFNVLNLLNPKDESVIPESEILAKLMCPVPPNSTPVTEYFYESATSLIQCFILAVMFITRSS